MITSDFFACHRKPDPWTLMINLPKNKDRTIGLEVEQDELKEDRN